MIATASPGLPMTAPSPRHYDELEGPPLTIYLYLLDVLNPAHLAAVKEEAVASRLGLHRTTVWKALRELVAKGYLEKGVAKPGSPGTYRLVYERMP